MHELYVINDVNGKQGKIYKSTRLNESRSVLTRGLTCKIFLLYNDEWKFPNYGDIWVLNILKNQNYNNWKQKNWEYLHCENKIVRRKILTSNINLYWAWAKTLAKRRIWGAGIMSLIRKYHRFYYKRSIFAHSHMPNIGKIDLSVLLEPPD